MTMRPRLALSSLLLLGLASSGSALAGTLKLADATASSETHDDSGVSYAAKNVKDGKQGTAWFEGDDGSGLGSWVQVNLDGEQTVTGFQIWNGYWLTYDMWQRNNRVKDLEVELADGTKQSFTLKDDMKPEEVHFPSPVKTSSLKFRIKGIYSGNTFNDTAISEVRVFDDKAEDYLAPTAYTASTTYPADTDGDYEPDNVGDAILDSMWCEGDKAGDGTGQWLQVDFGGSKKVGRLVMINGNADSFGAFMKANSATSATLTFSDGTTQAITVKPTLMEQTITFGPKTSSSVRITFDEVRKGKEFNDLCISEARFYP